MQDRFLFDIPGVPVGDLSGSETGSYAHDPELAEVIAAIKEKGRGSLVDRFGRVFRQSVDEILDGRRTRRYNFLSSNVANVEKSYLGAKAEIIAREEFGFGHGSVLDYLIVGHEVDAKFSATGEWMIAPKNVGKILLVMQASESTSTFSVGVVRALPELLRPGATRDQKRSFHAAGKASIRWLAREAPYPKNQLMELFRADPDAVASIFSASGSGQQRVNELFRRMQKVVVNRTTVQTVASQEDSSKRVRDARLALRDDGILILGYQQRHREIGKALGLPDTQGNWISVRVHPADFGYEGSSVSLGGVNYRIAESNDCPHKAPVLPSE
ncbi:NaeI family type II restriction endonuclease [Streptomyces sp. NBC_00338]|uniref:NaeI family type II restriction endonuclease n=1 Tax=Streptomyces sp. NBC_00338 TaxID=2975715 RepID=UPI002259C5AF|nr:NaeI family type II restriction endonuclease [Streptomyces sp. NBC_00338]MCX5140035.1 NaeI family type II restriction endonuclease [Streptomyces sp. NBC_00338]